MLHGNEITVDSHLICLSGSHIASYCSGGYTRLPHQFVYVACTRQAGKPPLWHVPPLIDGTWLAMPACS